MFTSSSVIGVFERTLKISCLPHCRSIWEVKIGRATSIFQWLNKIKDYVLLIQKPNTELILKIRQLSGKLPSKWQFKELSSFCPLLYVFVVLPFNLWTIQMRNCLERLWGCKYHTWLLVISWPFSMVTTKSHDQPNRKYIWEGLNKHMSSAIKMKMEIETSD